MAELSSMYDKVVLRARRDDPIMVRGLFDRGSGALRYEVEMPDAHWGGSELEEALGVADGASMRYGRIVEYRMVLWR